MKVLAFDMTSKRLTVGVAEDDTILGCWEAPADRDRGNSLEVLINRALDQLNWRRADIEGLALCTGPGSLTATRIGWATASGWSLATGIPVTGWHTPEIQQRWWRDHNLDGRHRASGENDPVEVVYCMVYHRGSEFYCYEFATGQSQTPEPSVVTLGQWRVPDGRPAWIVGPGVLGCRDQWIASMDDRVQVVSEEYAIVAGDRLARWGVESLLAGESLSIVDSPLDYGLPPQFRKVS